MIDTKALREKILDLAIRGKLVPQDSNDEPASLLLEHIRVQKQQMVKEGKLKAKDIKNDTIIFKGEDNLHYEQFQDGTVKCIEDEIPFDVPEGWAWTRLRSISYDLPYGTSKKSSTNGKIAVIRMGNLQNGEIDYSDLVYSSDEEDIKKYYLIKGDLLFNRTNSIELVGKTSVYRGDIPAIYAGYLIRIRSSLNYEYLNAVMNSNYAREYCTSVRTDAVNQSNINASKLGHFLIAIPSKSEQKRIGEKISESIKIINIIEQEKLDLQTIATNVKSKILDLAIRGKLVPQDPNDEPASVLLERIRAEKEELIKQGKIKRDKKESVIFKGEDNSYYQDLPENWELVTFSNIANLISGRDLKPEEYNSDRIGIPYITGASNFKDGNILLNRWTTSPKSISIRNDILLTCKGTVGELAINDHDKIHIARQVMAIRVSANINLEYIKLFFESMILEIKKTADGLIPGISRDDILNLNIPIPPFAEQCRIVQAIKSSFTHLDNIENCIS